MDKHTVHCTCNLPPRVERARRVRALTQFESVSLHREHAFSTQRPHFRFVQTLPKTLQHLQNRLPLKRNMKYLSNEFSIAAQLVHVHVQEKQTDVNHFLHFIDAFLKSSYRASSATYDNYALNAIKHRSPLSLSIVTRSPLQVQPLLQRIRKAKKFSEQKTWPLCAFIDTDSSF